MLRLCGVHITGSNLFDCACHMKTKGNMYEWAKPWNPLGGECPHQCAYCLDGGTLIMMSDFTQKRIKDVMVGDMVVGVKQSSSGYKKFDFVRVTEIFNRTSQTIKITTEDSSLICTREHELMGSTAIRHCTDWRQARMFSPLDTIKFITNKSRGGFTEEQRLGYLRGVIDGDGCFYVKKRSVKREKKWMGFDMVCVNKQLMDHIKKEAESLLGVILRVGVKKVSKGGWGKDCPMLTCTKTDEVLLLENNTKFRINKEFAKGYLAGMIDTDGSVGSSRGSIRIAQSKIANSVKYRRILDCLSYLNIPYIEETNVIRILSDFGTRIKFLFEFGLYHSEKSKRLLFNSTVKGSKHSEVICVEKHKEIDVYNIATESENYIANGFVVHNCSTKTMMRFPEVRYKYSGELRLFSDLYKLPNKAKTIFVCAQNDLFAKEVPLEFILRVLQQCNAVIQHRYFFQTKNPRRYVEFLFYIPKGSILCTTIETNRWYPEIMRNAPHPELRALAMNRIDTFEKQVTIEPIMDFDLDEMVSMIKWSGALKVNIGADSKHNHLPEPSKEKVLALIEELQKFTVIERKANLARLLK